MGKLQDQTMETKFSEYIFNIGNEYSKENNFKLAIASYSWAIAFNKDFTDTSVRPKFSFSLRAPINYKIKYLNKRGLEYLKNNLYLQAINDFRRSINIDPERNAEAFSGWQHAYYDYKIHPSLFFNHLDLFYGNYRETYNFPKDWPKNAKPKPDSRHVFEDIWIAINAGGTQKAIDYSNTGLRSAINGNWCNRALSLAKMCIKFGKKRKKLPCFSVLSLVLPCIK